MDYERKYKEALERASKICNSDFEPNDKSILCSIIFPELKESEDEKTRKDLTEFIKSASGGFLNSTIPCKTFGEWLEWLEKQGKKSVNIDVESMVSSYEQRLESQGGTKYTPLVNMRLTAFRHGVENVLDELNLKKLEKQAEKKPADKVEPKFKVGDWIIATGEVVYQIKDIQGPNVTLIEPNGDESIFDISVLDDAKLWTIADVKDGDVLVDEDNNIGLYLEEKDDVYWHSCIYLGCDNCLRGFSIGGYHKHKNTKPATKEQRDLLFQKMKEAGYEWDSEKKELKKIEPKKVNANKVINWVNPDKVIEWLKGRIRETKEYFGEHGVYYDTHLTLPYSSIEDLINDFKEDFGL
jgi:hypothetical protein